MAILHCTRKLLRHLPVHDEPPRTAPGGLLDSWYATLLVVRPKQLVILVHEETRLPVLLPAAPLRALLERIPGAVAEVLEALGVEGTIIARERDMLEHMTVASTQNRSVLGTMNDFVAQFGWIRDRQPDHSLLELSLMLAEIPLSPLRYGHASEAVRILLRD
jgi:hypothetical protein